MKTWNQWVEENHPNMNEQLGMSAPGPVPLGQPAGGGGGQFSQDVPYSTFIKSFSRDRQMQVQKALSQTGAVKGSLSAMTMIPAATANQLVQQFAVTTGSPAAPAPVMTGNRSALEGNPRIGGI